MSATQHSFAINIHFPDGNSDGYRTVTKTGWVGRGVICPQSLFPEKKKEPEFQKPGVYVLIGTSDGLKNEKIYIGEGDPVLGRLNQHYAKKDFWRKVIFFTSVDDSLNKVHVQYLESRLFTLAHEAKQCDIDNGNVPALPALSKNDRETTEVFLHEMLRCFSAIGLRLFKKPETGEIKSTNKFLRITMKDIVATGYEEEDGFVVCAGSQAVLTETPVFQSSPSLEKARRDREFLIKEGILKPENGNFVFTQDYQLSSPSAAANVVLATPYNGLNAWKNEKGTTLKQIREQESAS